MKIAFSMSLIIFLLSITYFAVKINRVKASDTIYIRADGSIEPLSANITSVDNVTYTFTGNVSDGIVAERNDTIIDGDEYTLQGSGVGVGLNLTIVHNITIRNMNIKNFEVGFRLEASSKISIQGNNITNNKDEGVYFRSSSNNNTISGNHITANKLSAVQLSFYSNNNTVSGNTITNSSSGVYVDNSNYNTISGNHITAINKLSGVGLSFFANYNTVSGNHITNNDKGVGIFYSSNNTVSGNHITNNDKGVSLESSNYTTVSGNHITANNEYGVILSYFNNYNTVSENNITNSEYCVQLIHSNYNNTVSENNITNNDYGVQLFFYDNNYNTISGNNISYNSYGIWVEESDYNEFYHNYIDNINQTYVEPGYANIWDKGYPTGGNYWSDYKDKYPNATEIDESGIWDTPYIIDELNQDNYPIVPEFPSLIVLPLFMITTIFVAIMYKRKHSLS